MGRGSGREARNLSATVCFVSIKVDVVPFEINVQKLHQHDGFSASLSGVMCYFQDVRTQRIFKICSLVCALTPEKGSVSVSNTMLSGIDVQRSCTNTMVFLPPLVE